MEIPLVNSHCVATVDDDSKELVVGRDWRLSPKGYVVSGTIFLHRMLVGIPTRSTITVHHKDGNRLNNSKSNLCRTSRTNHGSITIADETKALRSWAEQRGIKGYDAMFLNELRTLKTNIEKHTARILRLSR